MVTCFASPAARLTRAKPFSSFWPMRRATVVLGNDTKTITVSSPATVPVFVDVDDDGQHRPLAHGAAPELQLGEREASCS